MNAIYKGIFIAVLLLASTSAFGEFNINVTAGDNQGLIDAINEINTLGDRISHITIVPDANGNTEFVFTEAYQGTKNALPVFSKVIVFVSSSSMFKVIKFTGSGERDFRFLTAQGEGGVIFGHRSVIEKFGIFGESGGAILAIEDASVDAGRSIFIDNFTNINGGAIALTNRSTGEFFASTFENNRATNLGGAISVEQQASLRVFRGNPGHGEELDPLTSIFRNNEAGVFGCDLNVQTSGNIEVSDTLFQGGNCPNVLVENPTGKMWFGGNTILHNGDAIDSTDAVLLFANIFQTEAAPPGIRAGSRTESIPKTEDVCSDFGSGAFVSEGHNISTEDSCSLTQDSDQPNTDPMISFNENGFPVLDPGSPAIDAGTAEVLADSAEDLAVLPCGYVDINGVARPQDGNGDGQFECDSGASEFTGAGMTQAGHSGAFYNALRNGEGNYVEILSDELAVVYTFTFRPDGSGPAWFIGVGDVRDNSIVIDELLRPTGTSFGVDFDPDAIEFSEAGGMSMIFPDCHVAGDGGSVAYSGDEDLGYEGVLSRAQRITAITGCDYTPTLNAGLSGSFFDPARNGEGLIVQWLTNGDVIAIFFTFDQNGDQFWTFGVGTPTGKSVTIQALYPATNTKWGRNFTPGDVDLQSWGTFDLTWTDCNTLAFDYSSSVSGYGSGSLDYTRVSTLQGTSCPP